jgi:hypothetical protein
MDTMGSPTLRVPKEDKCSQRRRELIKEQVGRFTKDSVINHRAFTSMDDFQEMKEIEKEFGSLDLGFKADPFTSTTIGASYAQQMKAKADLMEQFRISRQKEQMDQSHWKLFANKITNTNTKFDTFITLIQNATEYNN